MIFYFLLFCFPLLTNSQFQEIIISSSNINSCSNGCCTFADCLTQAINNIAPNLNIFLDGDNFFLLDSDFPQWVPLKISENFIRNILPLSCRTDPLCSQTTTIFLKTERFFFDIRGSLGFRNLKFLAADLPVSSLMALNPCLKTIQGCCSEADYLNTSSVCYLKEKIIARGDRSALVPMFSMNNNSIGISANLTINNCKFRNFYAIKTAGYYTLIQIDSFPANISITGSDFNNFYFLEGFITATFQRKKKAGKTGIFLFSMDNSSVQNYNIYDINERVNTFYGNNIQIAYIFAFQYSQNVTFSNSRMVSNGYKFSYFDNCLNLFSNITFTAFNVKFDNNDLLSVYYSFVFISQVNFTQFNSTSRILSATYSNSISFVDSNVVNCSFRNSGLFLFSQNNFFYLNNTLFQDISITNSSLFLNVLLQNRMIFRNNKYLRITNPIFFLDTNNSLQSNSESFTSLATISISPASLFSCNKNNTLTFDSTLFYNLSFQTSGLPFNLSQNNVLSVQNVSVMRITAQLKPAFIFLNTGNIITITSSSFNSLDAYLSAIVFAYNSNFITVLNSFFADIHAQSNGGLIQGNQFNIIVFADCSARSIISDEQGGFVFLSSNNTMSVSNSLFVQSRGSGGVFFGFNYNTLNVTDSVFKGCSAYNDSSGGVLIFYTGNNVFISSCFFENSFGSLGGVAFFQERNIIQVIDSQFSLNQANQGSCFFIVNSNSLTINNSFFYNCSSKDMGGVILAYTANNLSIYSTIFVKSHSQIGGVVYLSSVNFLDFQFSSMNMSYSTERGGCFYLNDENLINLNNSVFDNSESFEESGCIYSYVLNNMHIQDVSFSNIYAKLRGGAVFLYFNSNVTLKRVSFTDNFAELRGGCLYISNRNRVVAKNISINDNTIQTNFQFMIFFLNNNFFTFKNITFLRSGLGIFISHFNEGDFQDITILQGNASQSKPKFNSGSYHQNQNFTLESITESKIFLMVYSSTILLGNLTYSNLTYPLIYAEKSIINLTKINTKFCILSPDDVPLFYFQISTFNASGLTFLSNRANLFKFNASNATFSNLTIIYSDGSYKIIEFLDGICKFIHGIFKFDIPLSKKAQSKTSDNSVTNLYFFYSIVQIQRLTFINNLGNEGGALTLKNCNVSIFACSFLLNSAESNGGAISYDIEPDIDSYGEIFTFSVRSSIFMRNRVPNLGGAIAFYKLPDPVSEVRLSFVNNSFTANQGNWGGAIYLRRFDSLKLEFVNFIKNRAIKKLGTSQLFISEGFGGSLFIAADSEISYKTSFQNLKFTNNSADVGGAIFFESDVLEFSDKNTYFSNNIAQNYGPNMASRASRISFSSVYEKNQNKLFLGNLQSGNTYNCLYSIISHDKFDQLVITVTFEFTLMFGFEKFIQQFGNTINTFQNNIPTLSDVNTPGSYCSRNFLVQTPLHSSQMFFRITLEKIYSETSPIRLFLSFRSCQMGEILSNQRCVTCSVGYYLLRFNENTTECTKCHDSDPFYCYGGSNLTPKPSYWRIDYYSENFLLCPNPASCLGYSFQNASLYNQLMATGECAYGYKGVLCGECIENFGIMDKFFCAKCDNDYIYFYMIGSMIFKLIIILFSVHKAMIMCLSLITSNIVNLRKVISNILMKILFNHLTCLIIVFSIPSLIMPDFIKKILHFTKSTSPNVTEVMSLECVMKNLKMRMNPQTVKLLIIWISPVILILISSAYLAMYLRNKKKKYVIENIMDRLRIWFAIFMTVLMIVYPDCMKICFETFNCLDVGYSQHPQFRLAADYSVTCWHGLHWDLIYGAATPFLIIFGIGFPVFVLFKLISHWKTNSLNNKTELLKYGYFYFGYDKQFFFWDIVILARKIAILLIDVFFLTSFNNQVITQPVLAIFLVLFISLYIQLVFQPYRRDKLDLINSLENKSLIALVGTVYVGLLNMEVVFGEKSISSLVLFFLVFLINLNFAVFWILAFIKYIVSDKLQKWKIALMSCFIHSYALFKKHFYSLAANKDGVLKDRMAMLDKYTIELKKRTRKARQNPMQESLIEQIRKSSLKDLKKKRKTTICIKQPDRFKCANCEMTLKIEEENKKLRDELFSMREKIDNKDAYLKELHSKLSQMKTMLRTNNKKDLDFDIKALKTIKTDIMEIPIQKSSSMEIEKSDSEILGDKLKNHFNMVKCLHQKEKLLAKENYEISTRIFLYTSKDIKKEFYLNFVLYYDFEVELNDMLINYEYDQEKIRK